MTVLAETPTKPPSGPPSTGNGRLVDLVLRARELSIAGALVVLVVATTIANPRFLSAQGVEDIFLNASILALLAVGQTMVVVTRNIDLSVGSVVGLVAFVTGKFAAGTDRNVLLVILLGLLIGALCGLVNGLLVSFCRVPALVVTLGTLYVIQGIDHYVAHGEQISASDLPSSVLALGNDALLGIPYLPIITVVVMLGIGFYLRSYSSGREFYAIGSNPEAARLAGVPIRRRVLSAYLVSGVLAGLAGVLWLARFGTVVADAANGWELKVVSAVVVGGVAIVGGVGTVYGAALGALLLTTIGSVLVVLKVNPFWQDAITGVLLLLAISVDRLLALRVTRTLKAKSRSRRGRRRANGNGNGNGAGDAAGGGPAATAAATAKEEGNARDEV
ncbi:ABC transporter permease [Actinomadura viridis]|uniref:Autoinducer 2 import system permease protein LsrC n=1 Tax=Actinomadura viridis TaxID=58110 RepID=A0A931DMG9_9ACTN|nr:ABC transporter permease [Actinomadura viridis]MBG6090687.1 rhamnose transport system permease protein [Actinomadura viridis]